MFYVPKFNHTQYTNEKKNDKILCSLLKMSMKTLRSEIKPQFVNYINE